MDKRKVLRFFLIPALFGLAVTGLVYALLQKAQPAGKDEPMVTVVTAKQAIPARTKITGELIELRTVPKRFAWPGAMQKADQVVGKVTTKALAAGEPILPAALNMPETDAGLAFAVPAGFRAMTVPADEITGVAGRLAVGDHVDVIAILPKEIAGLEKATLLLEDLVILALGKEDAGKGKTKETAKAYSSVTLALKPQDGVLLALAREKGVLQFMLRPAVKEGNAGQVTVTEDVFKK